MLKTVLSAADLRFYSKLLHAGVTVDKVLWGGVFSEQFGGSVPVILRALHTHLLPWAGTKGPF